MVNYGNGKIYKIISDKTDKIYIGSTTKKYLSQRMDQHRSQYKQYLSGKKIKVMSFEVIKHDDARIILLELYPCKSKEELLAREQYHIDQNKSLTLNKHNALGRDKQKLKQHKEKFIQSHPNCYKDYEKIRERPTDYKEKKSKYASEIITCDVCNVELARHSYYKHIKRTQHTRNMIDYIPNKPLF